MVLAWVVEKLTRLEIFNHYEACIGQTETRILINPHIFGVYIWSGVDHTHYNHHHQI